MVILYKYKNYQRKIRQGQIERAQKLIKSGRYKQRPKNQNDPHRFIARDVMTADGEACTNLEEMEISQIIRINKKLWEIEECFRIMKTEFKARPVFLQREDRIKAHFLTCFIALFIYRILDKKLDETYTCEEIIRTLREMTMYRPGEKMGYMLSYTRTDLTDALHEASGFRTDYEILTDISMKRVIRETKKK